MITLSLCMIVKNEENTIERCLESVKGVFDEIIIVDTGSTDNTKEISSRYTDKVYDFNWISDFSKARNFSYSKATSEYIMWMDADDIINDKEKEKLLELKENFDKDIDCLMMKYNTSFDEDGNVQMSYYRERIVRNCKDARWLGIVHEVITPFGKVEYSDIAIEHRKIGGYDQTRNLIIYEKALESGNKLEPRQQFYYSRELMYNKKFDKAIKSFEEFLSCENGWKENKISACIDLANIYRQLDDKENQLKSLFRSFEYDSPRAEVCIDIGKYFFNIDNYNTAIFWYSLAANMKPDLKSGGFYIMDAYDYIPYIELCVCYDRLGMYDVAHQYNEMAGRIKPSSKAYQLNKEYFDKKIKKVDK